MFLNYYLYLVRYVSWKAQYTHKNLYAIVDGTTDSNEILRFGLDLHDTFFDGCLSGLVLVLVADIKLRLVHMIGFLSFLFFVSFAGFI